MIIKNYKDFLNESSSNIFTITFFNVDAHTNKSTELIYYGTNLDKAKTEFKSASYDDLGSDYGGTIILSKKTSKYEFIGDLEDGYYEMSDFPIEDYYNDKDYYKLIDDGEIEEIDTRTVEPINKKSEELLFDVQDYFKKEYGNLKYNTIIIDNGLEDDDYIEYGRIQLRITDHSENVLNNDRYGTADYYISVVIADKDYTRNKFLASAYERRSNELELSFNSDDNFNDVIDKIKDEIINASEYIKEKHI